MGEASPNLDYHSRYGAGVLSWRIEIYWRSLGFNVRTWLEPISARPEGEETSGGAEQPCTDAALWSVRSSLANGLPPGRANPFHGAERRSGVRFGDAGGERWQPPVTGDAVPVRPSPEFSPAYAAPARARRAAGYEQTPGYR